MVRKTWEQRSHSRHSFKVVDVIGTLDENTLRNARILHDTFLGAPGKDTVAKASVATTLVKNRLPYIAQLVRNGVMVPRKEITLRWHT